MSRWENSGIRAGKGTALADALAPLVEAWLDAVFVPELNPGSLAELAGEVVRRISLERGYLQLHQEFLDRRCGK